MSAQQVNGKALEVSPEQDRSVVVTQTREATDDLWQALTDLLPQLSTSAPTLTRGHLDALLATPSTNMLAARLDSTIVGVTILVIYPLMSGVRARIEDVVVNQSVRGCGIGEALTRAAIELARAHHARTVDLTCTPSRSAARKMYARCGFQPRDTTNYRLSI
ncbi:MAG: putative acetyltransferase [Nocardia sp.]|nr:putative acetyltransferase [Nocardia sp.]